MSLISPTNSSPIQFINADGLFNDQLPSILKKWPFYTKGFNYHIVAILGAQSSGKSTLLNLLFSTSFSVMNARTGRSQTTLGVWIGDCNTKDRDILVLDVEGTDSRERGEDHAQFERKTSLLSLSLAQVLVINLWMTDIGRHDGANYSLLKVVFELYLQLFDRQSTRPKPRLLFVFRDYILEKDGGTSLSTLESIVTTDMNRIWDTITKSPPTETKMEDCFILDFVALVSKPYQPSIFGDQVNDLRDRFLDPIHPNPCLIDNHMSDTIKSTCMDIPADGLAQYIEDIWKVIQSNEDLNLPSQKEMLSMVRCEQIAQELWTTFKSWHDPIHDHLISTTGTINKWLENDQGIEKISKEAKIKIDDLLNQYQIDTIRYDPIIGQSRKNQLKEKIKNIWFSTRTEWWIHKVSPTIVKEISIEMTKWVPSKDIFIPFGSISTRTSLTPMLIHISQLINNDFESSRLYLLKLIQQFNQSLTPWIITSLDEFEPIIFSTTLDSIESNLIEPTSIGGIEYQFEKMALDQFHLNWHPILNSWFDQYLEFIRSQFTKLYQQSFLHPLPLDTDNSISIEMIHDIIDSSKSTWIEKLIQFKIDYLDSFNRIFKPNLINNQDGIQFIENEISHYQFDQRFDQLLKSVMKEESMKARSWMDHQFSQYFLLDPSTSCPRQWQNSDQITKHYQITLAQITYLLDILSINHMNNTDKVNQLSCFDRGQLLKCKSIALIEDENNDHWITMETLKTQLIKPFLIYSNQAYIQAQEIQSRTKSQTNPWILAMIVLALFGWNEMAYLLHHPSLLILITFISMITIILHRQNILIPVIQYSTKTAAYHIQHLIAQINRQGGSIDTHESMK